MQCPQCKNETAPVLFCHTCDAYLPNYPLGTKGSVGRRLAAFLLDVAAFWIIILIISVLAGLVGQGSSGLGVMTFIWGILAWIGFTAWFLAKGKTIGKAAVHIRAVDKRNGANPGFGRMLIRETIGKWISGFLFGLGWIWAIFDADGQAWHDKIAGTVVLKEPLPAGSAAYTAENQSRSKSASSGVS